MRHSDINFWKLISSLLPFNELAHVRLTCVFSLLLVKTCGKDSNRLTKFLFTCENIFFNPCLIAFIMTGEFLFFFFSLFFILFLCFLFCFCVFDFVFFFGSLIISSLNLQSNSLGRRVNLKLISCCLPALYT